MPAVTCVPWIALDLHRIIAENGDMQLWQIHTHSTVRNANDKVSFALNYTEQLEQIFEYAWNLPAYRLYWPQKSSKLFNNSICCERPLHNQYQFVNRHQLLRMLIFRHNKSERKMKRLHSSCSNVPRYILLLHDKRKLRKGAKIESKINKQLPYNLSNHFNCIHWVRNALAMTVFREKNCG